MGNPIPVREPDPLPLFCGYFAAHVTAHEVGSHPTEVLVPHQRDALASAFTPLVSCDGGMLQPSWAGQRLQWVYGGLGERGVFFRVHSCGQLEYIGTSQHPAPEYVALEEACAAERPVSPGYVTFEKKEEEEGSEDSEFSDAPAVHVGGAAPLDPGDRPACLRCSQPMHYIGAAESDCFSDDFETDALVLLFYCGDCKLQCCLDQLK